VTTTPPSATAAGVVHAHARGRWTGRTVEIEGWVDPALPVSVTDEIGRHVAAALARELPAASSFTWISRAAPA